MTRIAWEYLPGGQEDFLSSTVDNALLHGDRGGGKTDTLIVDFLQDVGKGHGRDYNGILFRITSPALEDVITKCHDLIPMVFPDAIYNATKQIWKFKGGETLKLRALQYEKDYDKYHGHQYAWIGLEELTKWPKTWVMKVKSLNRGKNKEIFYRLRATTNPDGNGHGWVKKMFIDPAAIGVEFNKNGMSFCHYFVSFRNNHHLNANYISSIMLAVEGNENLKKAWIDGSWDIVAGGFFIDVWRSEKHIIEDLDVEGLDLHRTFDWGSAKPFSVGYFYKHNGENIKTITGKELNFPKNSIIRVKEYYGVKLDENGLTCDDVGLKLTAREIAENILDFESTYLKGADIIPSTADNAIYNDVGMEGKTGSRSIADEMEDEGVYFEHSDKSPGSRIAGAQIVRAFFKEVLKERPEKPCFYVCESCRDFIRTIPVLPRDDKKINDIDTTSEDHIWDEMRYFFLSLDLNSGGQSKIKGR